MKNNSRPGRVDVIYNCPTEGDRADVALLDVDTARTAVSVWRALKNLDYESDILQVNSNNLSVLKKLKSDLVFNLCEWTGQEIFKESELIKHLESLSIPYTGATAKNYYMTTDKIAAKKEMNRLRIPTPEWQVFYTGDEKVEIKEFPLIVKPVYEHGSVGISQNSVVTEEKSLRERVGQMIKTYDQPVLAERFIVGRELKVTVVGNGMEVKMLPLAEVVFGSDYKGKWKILTFPSKWMQETAEFRGSNTTCPPEGLSEAKMVQLERLMLSVYRKLECRDYARYDVRMTTDDEIYFLEVNSNPSLENEPRYAPILSAARWGWSYEDLIENIVATAWERVMSEQSYIGEWLG